MTGHEVKPASTITPAAQDRLHHRRHELFHMRRRAPLAAFGIVAFLLLVSIVVSSRVVAAASTPSAQVKSVAVLGVQFINDHEALEPTTDAERARLASIEELFKSKLEASGRYKFVQISADTKAKIAGDPEIGHCGGCEIGYGEQLGGDLVAWVVVQKVSNLILNINVPHVCFFFAPGVPSASRSSSSGEILRSRSVRKANAYRGSLAVARFISSIGGRVSCAFKSSIRTFNK